MKIRKVLKIKTSSIERYLKIIPRKSGNLTQFLCLFLSEGTDTTDNPSYLDGINNSIRGCGIVCKSDFLKNKYTPKSKEKCRITVLSILTDFF